MPKIIDNIKEKINTAAFKLFAEKGYKNTSMKIVAEEVGISVGTLYNYYSTKQELFLYVFEQNLNQTYAVLNGIIEKNGDACECITVFYNELLRIREFSKEIIGNTNKYEMVGVMKEDLMAIMRGLIGKREGGKNLRISEKTEERVIYLLLLTIIYFAKEFPGEKEENIAFICDLFSKIDS